MTNDIHLAFAHPHERSAATEPDPRDRISVRDHVREVEIGAFQAERGTTQRIRFNVVVEIAPLPADLGDDVDRILSYDRITEAIEGELEAERLNLLETLAELIADRILLEPQALRAFIRIEKLDRGPGTLGVEIVRNRRPKPVTRDDHPHPLVVFVSNAAAGSPHLRGWLDQMERGERPVILAVEPGEGPRPSAAARLAQRRIDLLAVEQNAWVLAGRDRRCVVVGTRTELDWGMRHGQISVWAPSKMVLDATDGPEGEARDGLSLTLWLAREMEAGELMVLGTEEPDTDLPLAVIDPETPDLW
ncbi:MAG: dihydroneopterin aldolase [Shimia sp.]